jgi:4a-hydroxytetrahydrobiopterin dehydratase
MTPARALSAQHCEPCSQGGSPLPESEARSLLAELVGWRLAEGGKALEREYVMEDFIAARDVINAIAAVAEAEDHHPDLHLTGYRRLRVVLSTHAVGGLSKNDFILAAKIDALPKRLKTGA